MTEIELRAVLKEAEEKSQTGLFIWQSWSVWDDFGVEMKPGNENYDFAISQISKEKEANFKIKWYGFSMPGFIAISINKLKTSDEFFKLVLETCKKGSYTGPVTLIPLNEISKVF